MTISTEELQKLLDAATPGPWELDGIAIAGSDHRMGDVCLMGEPAQFPGDISAECDNWEANARLIAAAPDLAAELIAARAKIAAGGKADAAIALLRNELSWSPKTRAISVRLDTILADWRAAQ